VAVISCRIDAPYTRADIDPEPGGAEALVRGCSCPTLQPAEPDRVVFDGDCPVHPVDRVKPN
jgi:hypothetical protein